jgi:hypothetical protein
VSDGDVLTLRGEGLSFAAIASRLGFRRSREALDTFHRALQASDESAKPALVREELARLEVLEGRIRSRDAADPEKMSKRLQALEQLRARLSSAAGN